MKGLFVFNYDGSLYIQHWRDSFYSTMGGFFIFNHGGILYIEQWGDSLCSTMTGFFIVNHEEILYIQHWGDSLYSTMTFFILNHEGILYIHRWRDSLNSTMILPNVQTWYKSYYSMTQCGFRRHTYRILAQNTKRQWTTIGHIGNIRDSGKVLYCIYCMVDTFLKM